MLFFFFFLNVTSFFSMRDGGGGEKGVGGSDLTLMSQDRLNLGKSLEKLTRPLYLKNKFET